MRQLSDYLEAAKARQNCRSDRELARVMGISSSAQFAWSSGRAWPSDEAMTRLAALAGMDRDIALLELNIWRSPEGLARSAYLDMLRRLGRSAAAFFLVGSCAAALAMSAPAPRAYATWTNAEQIRTTLEPNVYYGNSRRRRRAPAWAAILARFLWTGRGFFMRTAQALMSLAAGHNYAPIRSL